MVRAAGFLGEGVASEGKRACARAPANLAKLADAALAFQLRGITQGDKERGVLVEVGQGLSPNVSRRNGQEAAGKNFAQVRDKYKALRVVDASRGATDSV